MSRPHTLAYTALRVFAALVLMQHAFQKLFGMFGAPNRPSGAAAAFSLMWFVGILELVGSTLVALGFLTRPITFLLAGGLTPENAAEAVRVTGARAVDVSSGVESSRGVKSVDLIRAFLDRVKAL